MADATKLSIDQLKETAKAIRRLIIKITTEAGSGHPTSSLSAVEVVTALYFGGFLRHHKDNPRDPKRDRFILSKGHAVPVLYSALCQAGYYTLEQIMTLRKLGSPFEGHPNMKRLNTMEASTGSLGQGLSLGIGHALACRLDGLDAHTFVMMGDGEMGEGQIWEAASAAEKYRLSNLTAIVDQNGYQQTGATKDVLDMKPFAAKFEAFGWHTQVIDGNSMGSVVEALTKVKTIQDRPTAIISQTKKGFGILPILEMAGDLNYHGKPLSKELAEKALALLS
ncbi:transketolase [Schlesneria paludicola]|uniref:transketolase n=1 Tax=Schlesneria paludicola TaxID=360056 RepID=UPI00029A39C1|nr:transketolase [Schlesneria paludicola]